MTKIQEIDLGLTEADICELNSAYKGTMTACEGGSEGAYG